VDANATVRPRFKASIEPIIDADDGLFVFSEGGHAWMPEPIFRALAPLLDGAHDIDHIFEKLTDDYPADQIFAALEYLKTHGYLAEDDAAEPRPWRAFWEHAGVAATSARARITARRVAIAAFGAVETTLLMELLGRNGLTAAPDGDCAIVVTDDYLRPDLAAWNAAALKSGAPWLLVNRSAWKRGSARCSCPGEPPAGSAWHSGSAGTARLAVTWRSAAGERSPSLLLRSSLHSTRRWPKRQAR
jgi:hypothetical protein